MDGLLDSIANIVENDPWLAFPACFLGGLVSSASPCVLAMIPLVIGFVGGYAEGSQRKAVQYSLAFTLGLTITFTILGVIAGAFGRLFGDVGGFWKYVLPPVAIILGLNLVGVFKLNIGISERFLPKRRALLGAFLMGLFFGIVASPCATPVLGVILTMGAVQDNIAYSGALLLAYALGHWVLILGAGISVGFAQRVLESKGISRFSDYSRKAAGVVLMGGGTYLLVLLF
ncbi:MAG: sulfite exporter TauE/SafE family protein [Chloroflexi bacterium]|nr:sulfite exporter TauE/SafE family protein [Chloroflexota bacterium]